MKIQDINWRQGARTAGIDVRQAFECLEAIRERDDGITARAVVDAAAPEDSVIHPYFEWDDAVAADKFRLDQADCLTRSIEIVYEELPTVPARVYEVVYKPARASKERAVYSTVEQILADPDTRAQLLAQAKREAESFIRKYNHLEELASLIEAINSTLQTLDVS